MKLMGYYQLIQDSLAGETVEEADILEAGFAELEAKIEKALQDDFNTSLAFSYFFDGGKLLTKALKDGAASRAGLQKAYEVFKKYLEDIMAVLPFEKSEEALPEGADEDLASKVIEVLLEVRNTARRDKNYGYGDMIRDELAKLDIEILDTKEGSTWRKK